MSDIEKSTYLGRLAVLNGLVPQRKLDACLEVQKRLAEMGISRKLGEVLIARGHVDEEEMESLQIVQSETRKVLRSELEARREAAAVPLPQVGGGMSIGEIVLRNRLLSTTKLEECVSVQKKARAMGVSLRLSEIMAEKGYMQPHVVEAVMRLHRRARLRKVSAATTALFAAGGLVLLVNVLLAATLSGGAGDLALEGKGEARTEDPRARPALPDAPRPPVAEAAAKETLDPAILTALAAPRRAVRGEPGAGGTRGGGREVGPPVLAGMDLEEQHLYWESLLSGPDPEAYARWEAAQEARRTDRDRERARIRREEEERERVIDRLSPDEYVRQLEGR